MKAHGDNDHRGALCGKKSPNETLRIKKESKNDKRYHTHAYIHDPI